MVTIKSNRELEIMRKAGKLLSRILQDLTAMAREGVSSEELDREAEKMTLAAGAKPAFKGYLGYRHTLCTSVNDQVVHGIPSSKKLITGDIIGLDFGLVYEGFYSDSAVTIGIGKISPEARKLMEVTMDSLYAGIAACRAGNTVKDISRAVEETIRPHGYGVVREFVGHGIGRRLHEEPQIPNYEKGASHLKLRPGMTICIEPMVNAGVPEVKVLADKWTAVTMDGKLSAHYEHSIAITDGEPEVLTDWGGTAYRSVLGLG